MSETSPERIVVIGGSGFYGRAVVRRLAEAGHSVEIAGRPPTDERVPVDLRRPETFSALEPFDIIVNLADSVAAPADALVTWVLREGKTLVECSAYAPFYRRTLTRPPGDDLGRVVLGAGLFPGWSTKLALELANQTDVDGLDLAVRISPLSGAGWATCLLMARTLALGSYQWIDDTRMEGRAVGARRRVSFPDGPGNAAVVDMPDVELLRAASGLPDVTCRLAVRPSFLLPFLRFFAAVVRWSGPFRRPLLALTHWQLALLRGLVLRDRMTAVELAVIAQTKEGEVEVSRRFADGVEATAEGVVAVVDELGGLEPGLHIAGELLANLGLSNE